MNRLLFGAITAAVLFGIFGLQSPAFADPGLPPQNTITMNFQNVDIPVLANHFRDNRP